MTALYAVTLVLGAVGVLAWIAALAISEIVEGWDGVDPERRFGAPGRLTVAAVIGFGLGGMSSTFAGWHAGLAFLAAAGGAFAMAAVAALAMGSDGAGST